MYLNRRIPRSSSAVSVGIILVEGTEPAYMERWVLEQGDVRTDLTINKQIMEFIAKYLYEVL